MISACSGLQCCWGFTQIVSELYVDNYCVPGLQQKGVVKYLSGMDKRYVTLQTLYEIVKDEPHPEHYLCTPREMILHATFCWELIHKHLDLLAAEGLVTILHQPETPYFHITARGITKAMTLSDQHFFNGGGLRLKIRSGEVI